MTTVFDANIVPIVIALLVGLLIGWWIFKRSRGVAGRDVDGPPRRDAGATPRPRGRGEGNDLFDEGAAAATDVASEVLGVQAHRELPGASGPPDTLEIMKGVGPKFVAKLHENGIIRFDQIARLGANEAAILDDKLGPFKGRLARDRVVEQARYLARGDRDGFEAKFGKLSEI
jgi:predicted flap endonuclease-1-like 5' DNA nuclease